jgi:hypothetical protein
MIDLDAHALQPQAQQACRVEWVKSLTRMLHDQQRGLVVHPRQQRAVAMRFGPKTGQALLAMLSRG